MKAEEILNNFLSTGKNFDTDMVLEAMREFAKQQAIEFLVWANQNKWEEYPLGLSFWYQNHKNEKRPVYTTRELYELFINKK